jgi:hypothetical protein
VYKLFFSGSTKTNHFLSAVLTPVITFLFAIGLVVSSHPTHAESQQDDNAVFYKLLSNRSGDIRNVDINGCNLILTRTHDSFTWHANLGNLYLVLSPSNQDSYLACDGNKVSTTGDTLLTGEGVPCVDVQSPMYGKEMDNSLYIGAISLTENELNLIKRKLSTCSHKRHKKVIVYNAPKMDDERQSKENAYRSAHICDHLYSGKAVTFVAESDRNEGFITGVGDGVASAKVTSGTYGYNIGKIIERPCSSF